LKLFIVSIGGIMGKKRRVLNNPKFAVLKRIRFSHLFAEEEKPPEPVIEQKLEKPPEPVIEQKLEKPPEPAIEQPKPIIKKAKPKVTQKKTVAKPRAKASPTTTRKTTTKRPKK
jgi:hypothetical protein